MIEVMVKYFMEKKAGHTAHPPPPTTAPPSTTDHPPPPTTPPSGHTLRQGGVLTTVPPKDAVPKDATYVSGHVVSHGNPITSSGAKFKPPIDNFQTPNGSLTTPMSNGSLMDSAPLQQITASRGVASSAGRKVPLDVMNMGAAVRGSGGKNIKARHFKPRGLVELSEKVDLPSEPGSGVGMANGGVVEQGVEQSASSQQSSGVVQHRAASRGTLNVKAASITSRETKPPANMRHDGGLQSKPDSVHVSHHWLNSYKYCVHSSGISTCSTFIQPSCV